jgi:hypothetical protein
MFVVLSYFVMVCCYLLEACSFLVRHRKGVIYVLLITIMRSDFRPESCYSGVMVYPGLAMVGELGSDDAK